MPKIIIDFDYTLFDADKFKDALYKAVEPFMIEKSRKSWDQSKDEIQYKLAFYDYKEHLKKIVDKENLKDAEKAVEKVIKKSDKFLYDDALDFFKKYKKYEIYIVSFGVDGFQKNKIAATGLDKKAKVIITRGEKVKHFKKIIKGTGPAVFIDDKGSEIDMIKEEYPKVVCYWMRRPRGKFINSPCEKFDHKINNLKIKL
ncbi:MAG: hypothetical protein ABH835_02275 [Patescibacteria group bacterium]